LGFIYSRVNSFLPEFASMSSIPFSLPGFAVTSGSPNSPFSIPVNNKHLHK
jgi:hypothetical protein